MTFVPRRPLVFTVLLALILTLVVAYTQESTTPDLGISNDAGFDEQVVDGEGMTVYVFVQDEEGVSTCVDVCTNNWPPLLADGEPVVGEGVDPSLVGTIEREDGTLQLTYAGQPLYTYARDFEPGDINGHALGQLFFVVSAGGKAITDAPNAVVAEIDEAEFEALMADGGPVYTTHCAVCHGNEGQGTVGPRVDGNSNLARTSFLVGRILNGYPDHGMPPFRGVLDDHQVAAVSTYIRNSWSNEMGPVTEEQVSEQR